MHQARRCNRLTHAASTVQRRHRRGRIARAGHRLRIQHIVDPL
jgi:hypothetical protein